MKPGRRHRSSASARELGKGTLLVLGLLLAAIAVASAAGKQPAASDSAPESAATPILTVCADPDNLPFSNRAGEGFENHIATLLAREMGVKLRYFWWQQQRAFVRHTLGEAQCDLWPGVPAGLENIAASRPYYRSSYVFVTRQDRKLRGLSFDDPRLRSLSIGVQLIGNDGINTPPAHAIARRGLTQNVRGYMPYRNIIEAVAKGDIDVALAWGPPAGFFASRSATPLRVEPVTPAIDAGVLPMTYEISMGIRRANPQLRQQIDALLEKDKPAIDAILRDYHVPLLPERPATAWAGPR